MSTVEIAYGKSRVQVTLPDALQTQMPEAPNVHGSADPLAVVARALDAPVDSPPLHVLAKGKASVAVVIPDGSRPAATRLLLLPILARLARAGLLPQQIRVVMARGIHAATPRAQVEQILGRDILLGLRPIQSAPDTPELNTTILEHPRLGPVRIHRQVATADLVVLAGYVTPHHLAGFGGGPKGLVPGVADRATVLAAHRLTLDTLVRPDGAIRSHAGRLERNPFRTVLLEVVQQFGKTFGVNAVLAPNDGIVAATAGEVRAAHAAAADAWQTAYAPAGDTSSRHDLVIVGCRPPLDANLIQCHKMLVAAAGRAKPGAPIIWAAPAGDGPGHDAFLPWFGAGKLPRHLAGLRAQFHPYGLTAYSIRRIAKDHPVLVVSELSGDLTRPMGLYALPDLQAAVDYALREHEIHSCLVLPEGAY